VRNFFVCASFPPSAVKSFNEPMSNMNSRPYRSYSTLPPLRRIYGLRLRRHWISFKGSTRRFTSCRLGFHPIEFVLPDRLVLLLSYTPPLPNFLGKAILGQNVQGRRRNPLSSVSQELFADGSITAPRGVGLGIFLLLFNTSLSRHWAEKAPPLGQCHPPPQSCTLSP